MLDLPMLENMPQGCKFATGTIENSPDGLFMTNSGGILRWLAVRGCGPLDWAIYCHWQDNDMEWIARHGDKVKDKNHIRKLVPCDDESLKYYRY